MSQHFYTWSGINSNGEHIKGTILANSQQELLTHLRNNEITVLCLKKKIKNIFSKIKPNYINQFFEQLGVLLDSGIVLIPALKSIQKNFANESMQNMLANIQADLKNGHSFSFALQKYPKNISNLYCQLVHIAEQTGTLPQVIKKIVEHQQKTQQIKTKFKKGLLYPSTVLCMASIVIGIIFTFVVPQFSKLYAQFNVELPLYTRLVITTAHNFKYIMGCVLMLICCAFFFKNSKFSQHFENFIFHTPLIRGLYKDYFLGIISLSLSILLKTRTAVPEALKYTAKTVNFKNYQRGILKINECVISGMSFSSALRRTRLFTPYFIHMVETGEESGKLDLIFEILTDFYAQQLHNKIEDFTKLFEPLLMIILGIILGMLVIALYLPIFKLGSVI